MTQAAVPDLIDLTVPITSGMPVYPGDPEVSISPALTVAGAGVNVRRVHLGSQTGTHVDAPNHIDDTLPRLDEIPLDRFTGPAVLVDARGQQAGAELAGASMPAAVPPGAIVVIVTGWSTHWGTDEYLRHPYLGADAARALVAAGVRTVAIDAASVDRSAVPTPDSPPADRPAAPPANSSAAVDDAVALPAHEVLCRAGVVIAENLTGAERLLAARAAGHAIELFLFPLPLAAADGAPIRAVARTAPRRAPHRAGHFRWRRRPE